MISPQQAVQLLSMLELPYQELQTNTQTMEALRILAPMKMEIQTGQRGMTGMLTLHLVAAGSQSMEQQLAVTLDLG